MSNYNHIFQPLQIKTMTLKNRIVMPPMGSNFAGAGGEINEKHINYYKERAKGGTGLIIVENVSVMSPQGSNGTTQLRIDEDRFMPGFYQLTEAVHKYGACISVQINHSGASAVSARTGCQPVSAGTIPSKEGGEIPRPLTTEEIHKIADKYADAARRVQIAGFDAVEVHAGHSYLISQFLSPTTNNRTDEFGGSHENRARFGALVMKKVREAVGPMFPIMLRISADELTEGGNTLEDTLILLEYLQKEADIIDVSAGLNSSIQYQIDSNFRPDGWRAYMAEAVKEKFKKPVMTTGNIRDPKVAEDILAKGQAELIGMGRGLIAEPQWVNKVQQGRERELRKCISCNIGCAGNRIAGNRPIKCTVNPQVAEGEYHTGRQVKKNCNVVVIGGGTAGLEAACTAAEVGCTTILMEEKDCLGGLAGEISKLPDKNRLGDFPKYLINRAEALKNLFIFKNTKADIDFIKTFNPDIIVNATGSKPLLPPIKGLQETMADPKGKVYSIQNMIDSLDTYPSDMKGKKVVVIGGGAVGIDVVEYFAPRGAEVKIVEMLPVIGRDLDPISKSQTKELFEKYGVQQYTNTALLSVEPEKFTVKKQEQEEILDFDYGFVCLGMKAHNPILETLYGSFDIKDVEIYNIGDSVRARRIIEGIFEGRNILTILEKRGFM